MKPIDKIQQHNPKLAEKIREQGTFITMEDVPELIKIDRFFKAHVRCNNARFTCPIYCLEHLRKIIESQADMVKAYTGEMINENTDWIRDVALVS